MKRRAVVLVSLGLIAGCYESGTPADGGTDGGDNPACTTDSGYTRCGGECSTDCPGGLCFEELGLCLPVAGGNSCAFWTRPPDDDGSPSCPDGWACWFDGLDTPADGEWSGTCAPPEACLLEPPEVPMHRCFWSDGAEVTRVPPDDECPDYSDVPWASCGNWRCDMGPAGCHDRCAGVNDERGFGLCQFGGNACDPENPAHTEICTGTLSQTCACMVTEPLAPTTVVPYGFLVPLAACERYAARYPGQVRCATP